MCILNSFKLRAEPIHGKLDKLGQVLVSFGEFGIVWVRLDKFKLAFNHRLLNSLRESWLLTLSICLSNLKFGFLGSI